MNKNVIKIKNKKYEKLIIDVEERVFIERVPLRGGAIDTTGCVEFVTIIIPLIPSD